MSNSKVDIKTIDEKLKGCQKARKGSNIITPLARISFPALFEPRAGSRNSAPDAKKKYSVSLLIPPSFDLTLLKEDAARAAKEKWGDKLPTKLRKPFLDAGEYEYEGYEKGWVLIRATSVAKPELFDGLTKLKITEQDSVDVYPGRWAVASLRAFAYDIEGSRGISFGLGNIKFFHHDDPMGGRVRLEDEFDLDEEYASIKGAESDLW